MLSAMRRGSSLPAYGFLAFPLAALFLFTLAPTIAGLGLSLFAWDGGGVPRFVGLSNFEDLWADAAFRPALRNTLLFVALSVPPTVVIGFLLAVAVNASWFAGKTIARAAFFLPTILSIVAIGFVWRWLLDPEAGLVNWALRGVGLEQPPDWLNDGWWPMASIVLVSVWRGVGFCMVLYLASLGSISRSLYEAAEVDGAGPWSVVRHVTWPQVAPTTAFLLITGVIGALQVFDIVFVMTGQVESDRTNVLNLYVYRQFTYGQLGYAAAIGVVIFTITILATLAQLAWYALRGKGV